MLENLTFEAKSLKTPVFIAEMQKMQKMQIENGKTTFGAKENMCIFSIIQNFACNRTKSVSFLGYLLTF